MDSGPSSDVKQQEIALTNKQTDLADKQYADSKQLRDLTMPGIKTAIQHYSNLASGDPDAIARENAPANEQIAQAAGVAKERITDEMPRGGEQRIAKENVDINQAGAVGRNATSTYNSAFPSLAALGNTGVGLSINQVASALSGYGGASNTVSNLGQQEAAGKATTMGFLGSLAGAGGAIGAAAACWIAEALWGKDDSRTHTMRHWLNQVWEKESRIGAIAMCLYRKFGVRMASAIEHSPLLRRTMGEIFNVGLRRARREVLFVNPNFNYRAAR